MTIPKKLEHSTEQSDYYNSLKNTIIASFVDFASGKMKFLPVHVGTNTYGVRSPEEKTRCTLAITSPAISSFTHLYGICVSVTSVE